MANYFFAQIDPRPASEDANNSIFNTLTGVLGIEVTIPKWAEKCSLGNIDPQHLGGNSQMAAIQEALSYELPPEGATLATIRCDLDSIGSMAVICLRSNDIKIPSEAMIRITQVAQSDIFANGIWQASVLPTNENRWPTGSAEASATQELAAMAALVSDFKLPLAERVEAMKNWILTGEESSSHREKVETERDALIEALQDGTIEYRLVDGIALVQSTHRAAMMVGYSLAPVVVALNPEFGFGDSPKIKKFTIAQHETGHVNLQEVLTELSKLEDGWGGSATIGGSPQGVSSQLSIEQVEEVVKKHLT